MEGGITFDSLLQNQRLNFSSDEYNSPWVSNSSHGDKTYTKEYNSDEDYETGYRQPPEKKRRLSVEQVECLEKSFKEENKLEPERKIELAKQLDLQPRQVAIWFQNRRARCKTKQLEKDYEILNTNYHHLKLEFDSLQKQNDQLKQEVQMLKEKLQQKELREKDRFPTIESKSDMQETNPVQAWSDEPKMVICKQEYANSVSSKSDIIDSYSPEGNRSSFLEPCDSSNVFENQSDFSQDEEDNLTILRCPKIEYESYIDPNEGSLGYPINDQSFWLWP